MLSYISVVCSFFFYAVFHYMTTQFIYSLVNGHLNFFQFGAVVNKAIFLIFLKTILIIKKVNELPPCSSSY